MNERTIQQHIFYRSMAEAVLEDTDWIVSGDGDVHWIAVDSITTSGPLKSAAIRQFLTSVDKGYLPLRDVDCRIELMAIDEEQVMLAAYFAAEGRTEMPPKGTVVTTYEEGGYAWTPTKDRRAPGARRFFRCEVRAGAL